MKPVIVHTAARLLLALTLLSIAACAAREPLPQPRRVADPSMVKGAVVTNRWELAAVAYEYFDQGLDYSKAGLEPVLLVIKNKTKDTPKALLTEMRGATATGDFLPYSVIEAEKLVFASETFKNSATQAARPGALGAIVGAGLGALLGTISGGDAIWKGAAIGAGIGGAAGAGSGMVGAEADFRKAVRQELTQYAWNDDPIPPVFTKVGYIYLPRQGIDAVSVTIRQGEIIETYRVPVEMGVRRK